MGEKNFHHFARFVMSKIKTSLGSETDGRNSGLWPVHYFIVCMPAQMVVSVSIKVHKHPIKRGLSDDGTLFGQLAQEGRHGVWHSLHPRICVGRVVRVPGGLPRLGHDVAEHC